MVRGGSGVYAHHYYGHLSTKRRRVPVKVTVRVLLSSELRETATSLGIAFLIAGS